MNGGGWYPEGWIGSWKDGAGKLDGWSEGDWKGRSKQRGNVSAEVRRPGKAGGGREQGWHSCLRPPPCLRIQGVLPASPVTPPPASLASPQDHKIRMWNLSTLQKSGMLIGHEGVVRTLTIRNTTLFSGSSDTKVKVWNLKTNDCITLFGHTSFVRAIAVDERGMTLYTGADDKKIKIWQARP